jgi:hypothetical protein
MPALELWRIGRSRSGTLRESLKVTMVMVQLENPGETVVWFRATDRQNGLSAICCGDTGACSQ